MKTRTIPGFSNYTVSTSGKIFRDGKELSPAKNGDGYMTIVLYKSGKPSFKYLHNLVASAFLPNPHNKDEVNHRNGNKADCSVSNLKWADGKENTQHAYDNGLAHGPAGEKNGKSVLSKSDVKAIRKSDKSGNELASQHGVDKSTISLIKNHERW